MGYMVSIMLPDGRLEQPRNIFFDWNSAVCFALQWMKDYVRLSDAFQMRKWNGARITQNDLSFNVNSFRVTGI